jgi:O-succinylbenzoic acid--CoA ligase
VAEAFDVFAAAREVPDRLALVEPARSWSYAELAQLCARALGWLERQGVVVDGSHADPAPVAVLALPTPAQLGMTFALMASQIPVLPLHPRLTHAERTVLLAKARARLCVDDGWLDDPSAALEHHPAPSSLAHDREAPLALVQTSGSTQGPRLALLSERAFRASALASAANLGWHSSDRWLLALPFAHVGGLSILTRCLAARSTLALAALAADGGSLSNAERLSQSLHTLEVSLVSLVPTQLEQLLALAEWQPPKSLRAILLGGAAANAATLERAWQRGLPVLPTYGMTEACSQICTRSPLNARTQGGVGRPLPGIELRVVEGEIQLRGDVLFSGYLDDGEPQAPCSWFCTGDLGHLDSDGCLHVLGRMSDQIITGGENVNPVEVEQALEATVAPRRLCVFGQYDALWGEQVAVAIEGPVDHDLVQHLARVSEQCLASFKRPRQFAFVERLPELASGKLARRALKDSRALRMTRIDYTNT